MRSNLTTVGMYNSNISYLAAPIIISLKYRYPPLARVSAISHFWYAQETNKLCVALEYRIVTSDILLHLSVSLKIVPVPPKERCQGLHMFCGHISAKFRCAPTQCFCHKIGRREKQQILECGIVTPAILLHLA